MKTQIAAIDFGTSKIVSVVSQSGGATRCDILGSGTVPYQGYDKNGWINPDTLLDLVQDSITAAELEANTKIREIYIGVPGYFIRTLNGEAEYTLPEAGQITEEDVNRVQDLVADKLHIGQNGDYVIHRSPAWFSINDGKKTMQPLDVRGSRLRASVSFITVDPEFVEDMIDIMGALGITIMGFVSVTLGQGLLLLKNEERDRVSALIDIGSLNSEISVFEGDAIVYQKVLKEGGGFLTGELAYALRLSIEEAEQIKRSYIFNPDEFDQDDYYEAFDENGRRISFPKANVAKVMEEQMHGLCAGVEETFRSNAERYLGPRSLVYLTGGGITLMRGGREYLADTLGRPVKVPPAKGSKMNSPIYSSTLGLVSLIFDSIEEQENEQGGLFRRFTGMFK